MLRKRILPVMLCFFLLCDCGRGNVQTGQVFGPDDDIPVKVAVTAGIPGCFVVGGERFGYPYELIGAYGRYGSREIELINEDDHLSGSIAEDLTGADVTLMLASEVKGSMLSVPLYSTNYVVLAYGPRVRKAKGVNSLTDIVGDGRVMMSDGFELTGSYDKVLDSLTHAELYVSYKDGYELADELRAGKFDYLVCELSEALLIRNYTNGIGQVYRFDEPIGVSAVFGTARIELYYDFAAWIEQFRMSKDYAELGTLYMKNGFGRHAGNLGRNNRIIGGISVWDDLIREVGEQEGVDWRLLSAIAYKESRFRHDVTSHRGATGIMQIMPVVARQFKVDQESLADPRVNIMLAAKLINYIDDLMGFSGNIAREDRLSIILAAYNSGIGTVTDARKLARAAGENPDSWAVVSRYLCLMGDGSFTSDTVRYRRFNGSGETLAFVDGVKRKYNSYVNTVAI